MSERPRLILLTPDHRSLLDRLGKITGDATITKKDIESAEGRKILSELSGVQTQAPRDLELLRQFAEKGRPTATLWAAVQVSEAGAIQKIDAPTPLLLAQGLLKNPSLTIVHLKFNSDSVDTQLPPAWQPGSIEAKKVVATLAKTNRLIASACSEKKDAPVEAIAEKVGSELEALWWAAVLVTHMTHVAQHGAASEKEAAQFFLEDFRLVATPYLKAMSEDPRTGAPLKLPPAFENALQVLRILHHNSL